MKLSPKIFVLSLTSSLGLAGCVVAPPQQVYTPQPVAVPVYAYTQPVPPPPGTIYVQPAYAAPAIGFVWAFHPRFGWGYVHHQRGWARGWR
ncbi:MAG: hypothetical protein QM533_01625 [Cytophagales bacterium]|nr:hypothetical protein [Cytophagales bacterium]